MNKKVAINRCYGGFSLSDAAYGRLIELGAKTCEGNVAPDENVLCIHESTKDIEIYGRYYIHWGYDMRDNPLLVQVIEELGNAANGSCADIEIVEIPGDIEYTIDDYDGIETVHEVHRTW